MNEELELTQTNIIHPCEYCKNEIPKWHKLKRFCNKAHCSAADPRRRLRCARQESERTLHTKARSNKNMGSANELYTRWWLQLNGFDTARNDAETNPDLWAWKDSVPYPIEVKTGHVKWSKGRRGTRNTRPEDATAVASVHHLTIHFRSTTTHKADPRFPDLTRDTLYQLIQRRTTIRANKQVRTDTPTLWARGGPKS